MVEDEIMREIRATREAFALRFNYDIQAMLDYLRAEGEKSGCPGVSFAPRRPEGWVEPDETPPAETRPL